MSKPMAAELKAVVVSDLEAAAAMLNNALERLHPSLDIYKAIKEVDDQLDSVKFNIEDGDYDRT
jgi:hypothetical protein